MQSVSDITETLSLSDLFGAPFLVLALLCVGFATTVALRPRTFWPLLLVLSILGNGPRVKGYFLLDELFVLCLLAGALIRVALVPAARGARAPASSGTVFPIWIGFLLVQSLAGTIESGDVRIVRYAVLYGTVGGIYLVTRYRGEEFPVPSASRIVGLISWTCLFYFLLYLGVGYAAEALFPEIPPPLGRFVGERFWSGSASSVFPALLAVPAALQLLRMREKGKRLLGWAIIGIMMVVGFYFFSRTMWLTMAALVAVSWRQIRVRQLATASVVFFGLAIPLLVSRGASIDSFVNELVRTSQALWSPKESDEVSRGLELRTGINTVLADPRLFLIGGGVFSHRTRMVPAHNELLRQYPDRGDFLNRLNAADGSTTVFVRTTGIAALIVDSGLVGMMLFAMAYLGTVIRLARFATPLRGVLIAAATLCALWLFASNILDMALWYLMLMPRGVLESWAESDAKTQSVRDDLRIVRGVAGHRVAALAT